MARCVWTEGGEGHEDWEEVGQGQAGRRLLTADVDHGAGPSPDAHCDWEVGEKKPSGEAAGVPRQDGPAS
jgi:hypothetical protein